MSTPQTLHTVPLPHSPLTAVSAIALGTAEFGTQTPPETARRLVAAYAEAGGNFFDSAHCYAFWKPDGLGASERTLGAVLRDLGLRDRAVIATKGGHPDNGPAYRRPDDYLSERVVARDIEESRERLGIDSIDLYYLHRDDSRVPVGEVIEMLNAHVAADRVRALGASNWSVERIAEANSYAASRGLAGFVASQVQYSLAVPVWSAAGEDPTVRYLTDADAAWHATSGLPVVAYSATAGGYFAGRGQEKGSYASPGNTARFERARSLAERLGATPTQIAVAWLMTQPFPVVPLFSTGSVEHLREVLGAASLTLSPEDAAALR
jgi:aryl-alcohol dehydrogenase-like predicted oxidoreductase